MNSDTCVAGRMAPTELDAEAVQAGCECVSVARVGARAPRPQLPHGVAVVRA